MSKVLAAIMAATVFSMVGAALLATSYGMSAPSQSAAHVVKARAQPISRHPTRCGATDHTQCLAGDRGGFRDPQAGPELVD